MTAIEKCGICGQPIKVKDTDVVQVHGGEGGLVHESCLQEYDDEAAIDESQPPSVRVPLKKSEPPI
jgi:hypothetical protein